MKNKKLIIVGSIILLSTNSYADNYKYIDVKTNYVYQVEEKYFLNAISIKYIDVQEEHHDSHEHTREDRRISNRRKNIERLKINNIFLFENNDRRMYELAF